MITWVIGMSTVIIWVIGIWSTSFLGMPIEIRCFFSFMYESVDRSTSAMVLGLRAKAFENWPRPHLGARVVYEKKQSAFSACSKCLRASSKQAQLRYRTSQRADL